MVVVVDDNKDDLALMGLFLKRLGFCAKLFPNGEAGLKWLKANKEPHVIFADLRMNGGMNGFKFAAEVRLIKPWGEWIGIFAYTSYSGAQTNIKCVEAGFDGAFDKPITADDLDNTLKMFRLKG